jgi:hypothetical protein
MRACGRSKRSQARDYLAHSFARVWPESVLHGPQNGVILARNSERSQRRARDIVTLKCEGEAFPESHRARLVVGFKE